MIGSRGRDVAWRCLDHDGKLDFLSAQCCVLSPVVTLCSKLLLRTIEEVRQEIQEVTALLASLRLKR